MKKRLRRYAVILSLAAACLAQVPGSLLTVSAVRGHGA